MTQRIRYGVAIGTLWLSYSIVCGAEPIARSPMLHDTMPWNLEVLAQPPTFEWIDAVAPVRSVLYDGEPYRGKPTRVFAYYATPGSLNGDASQDANLPAVVLIHGGGGTAFRDWVEQWAQRGYAAIAMDLAGSRPIEGADAYDKKNRMRLPDGGPDQTDETTFGSITEPVTEQWTFHAVAAAVRAHSLIRGFPEVDADRTAVIGISWGGYLTNIVAGVDSRFRAAVTVYGCGFLFENSRWLPQFARMTTDERKRWVMLWDPSRYLPAVSMPILFVNGTNDRAYPLDSYMRSFDVVPGVKQLRITVNMPHGNLPGRSPMEIGVFIDQHLLGMTALPTVGETWIQDRRIHASFTSPQKLNTAALHLTRDRDPVSKRAWRTLPATIDGDIVTSEAPPADATGWFMTITDARGATVSTRVTIHAGESGVHWFAAGAIVKMLAGLAVFVALVYLAARVRSARRNVGHRRTG